MLHLNLTLKNPSSHSWLISILLIIYVIIQSYCIYQLSPNIDETTFAEYGRTLLRGEADKDIVSYDSKLPITVLNAIPRAVEQVLNPGLVKNDWGIEDLMRGRFISLFITVLLALLIYQWTKELYGKQAALFSFIFFLLCPNFLAHGIFVGTDVYAALFLTASFYFLWKYGRERKLLFFILFSVAMGLAQISKFHMLFLYLIIAILLIIKVVFQKGLLADMRFKQNAVLLVIFLFTNWFIISASHLFFENFLPLSSYSFVSIPFQKVQEILSFINLPVPLPSSYVKSVDYCTYTDSIGAGLPGSINNVPYILGSESLNGFWYYYFVTFFYKLPIPVLLIWLSSFVLLVKRFSKSGFLKNEFYLLLPVLFYIIYLSFFYKTQLGIRHMLIIFPVLYIFSGGLFQYLQEKKKNIFIYLLILYQLISVSTYFPHFLPYTNEFILNKKMVYKKIADTNIEYGEGRKFLNKFLNMNSGFLYAPDSIRPGKIVLDANKVLGMNPQSGESYLKHTWAKNLIPADHIHSQYLIFYVSSIEADSLNIVHGNLINSKRIYRKLK
jgi:hypothetical protein